MLKIDPMKVEPTPCDGCESEVVPTCDINWRPNGS